MAANIQGSRTPSTTLIQDCVEEKKMFEEGASAVLQSNSCGIVAESRSSPPGELPEEIILDNYVIGLNVGHSHFIEQTIDGRYSKTFVPTGGIGIFPYQLPMKSRWKNKLEHLYIHLRPDLLVRHSQELFSEDSVELMTLDVTVEDLLVQQLCLAVRKELTNSSDDSSQVYVQSMADALAVHLLKNYSVKSKVSALPVGGLSPQNLKVVKEYINDNLDRKISLDILSECTKLSRYHLSHAFKVSVGLSPHQYIIEQRVARAKKLLKKGKISIAEVAISCGFTHQSHLNRHFKRSTGLTPKKFAILEGSQRRFDVIESIL